MSEEKIEFLSAVLLVSRDHERLAQFYRDVIGIPLEDEEHEGTLKHYGCTLGDVHFAIHPLEDFDDPRAGVGAVKLAFTVFDLAAFVERLRSRGVEPLYPMKDEGFCLMTALRDPDGNYLEFTQLGDDWFEHLEERRRKGHDQLLRWREEKTRSAAPKR